MGKKLGKCSKTSRGFDLIEWKDLYRISCSLQQSSLATDDAIWLGVSDVDPLIMASDASKYGIKTKETTGWVPFPVPKEVLFHNRMHLNRDQVQALVDKLNSWLHWGDLKYHKLK